MATRQTIMYDLGGTSTAGGLCTLRTNRLRAGQTLVVQRVSVRSAATNTVVANVGVDRAGMLYPYDYLAMTTAGILYSSSAEIWLHSDEQLRIDFTGAGNVVPVFAWVFGYLQEP